MTKTEALKSMDSAIANCADPAARDILRQHRTNMVQNFRAQKAAQARNWKKTQEVARRFWAKADFSPR